MTDDGAVAVPDDEGSGTSGERPRRRPRWALPVALAAVVAVVAVGGWASYRAIGGPDVAGGDGDGYSAACLPFDGQVQVHDGAWLHNDTGHTVRVTDVEPRSPRGIRVREVRVVTGPDTEGLLTGVAYDPADPVWDRSVVLGEDGYELAPDATVMAVLVAEIDPGGAAWLGSAVSYRVGLLPYVGRYPLATAVLPEGVRSCPDDIVERIEAGELLT